jgi:hypothetical protein
MIHDFNRDLLVLSRAAHLNQSELEKEMELLNAVLYHIENWHSFCIANEIIDVNRRKIIHQPHLMERILRERKQKSFVFTNNKN